MSAEPFAVAADYAALGYENPFTSPEILEERLAAASRFVRAEVPGVDARIDAGKLDPDLVKDVVCRMVNRSVPAEDLAGFTQVSDTAGPYSEAKTVANPAGDYYLTKQEKSSLGNGSQRAYSFGAVEAAAP